ncbi:hypothetical protein D3C86_1247430 [compost metagenome]
MQIFDPTIRHQQAVFDLDQGFMACSLFETGQYQWQVIGVGSRQEQVHRGRRTRRVFENSCRLLRPAHSAEVCAKAEASGLGQALGTDHIDFIVAQVVGDLFAAQRQINNGRQHRQAVQQVGGRFPALKPALIQAHRRQHQHAEQGDRDHRADRQQIDRHQQQRDIERGGGEVGSGFGVDQYPARHDQAHQPHQEVLHGLETETEHEARSPLAYVVQHLAAGSLCKGRRARVG